VAESRDRRSRDVVSDEGDPLTETLASAARDKADHDRKQWSLERRNYAQDIKFRRMLCERLFGLTIVWLWGVFLLVVATAINPHLYVAENVMLALVGTTTATVLGLFGTVVLYFFSRR